MVAQEPEAILSGQKKLPYRLGMEGARESVCFVASKDRGLRGKWQRQGRRGRGDLSGYSIFLWGMKDV